MGSVDDKLTSFISAGIPSVGEKAAPLENGMSCQCYETWYLLRRGRYHGVYYGRYGMGGGTGSGAASVLVEEAPRECGDSGVGVVTKSFVLRLAEGRKRRTKQETGQAEEMMRYGMGGGTGSFCIGGRGTEGVWEYNIVDLFNLKFTTHVQPNRKGICLHLAVTSGLNIPLGAVFERKRDNSVSCFKRLLDFLFGGDGSTDLRNVDLHSDRGYMLPKLVFEYLLSAGAEVVGTCKRMAQCWPFTYNQKEKPNDYRTHIDPKGSATLYLKWCKAGAKYLFASAFRNGSESVATALSSLHNQHQWEGVVFYQSELDKYRDDPNSLRSEFFQSVDLSDSEDVLTILDYQQTSIGEQIQLDAILNDEIEPYTLRQGMFYFCIVVSVLMIS
jgi:hypothetical protein